MRILLIEDEKRITDFIARGLEEIGYSVDTAANGQAGLSRLSDVVYDLIVLDLMLPDMDGLSVLEKIRNREARQPVLILSAR